MRTPHTLTALQLLEDLLPHCHEHGGKLFSCEAISNTLCQIEDEAVADLSQQLRSTRRGDTPGA